MSAGRGLRVAVVGATGALGSEVLAVLEERRFPVRELVPLAGEGSAGEEIAFRDETLAVRREETSLRGAELVFLCAPPAASLEWTRAALRAEAPTLDLSGGLQERAEVPLLVAGVHAPREALEQPLVTTPTGPALAWILALAPLHRELGLRRVVGTTLEAASGGGRRGIEALSSETVALFNQQDLPEPETFGHPVAFDCVTAFGEMGTEGATRHEEHLVAALRRLLGEKLAVAVTAVRVPTFCGDGASLAVETERGASPESVRAILREAPGVRLAEEESGVTTRASAGRDVVLVARVRRDPGHAGTLLLWLAADALRLAAANGVRLAEARFCAS